MSWGTDFTADIYLIREKYENIYELDETISEVRNNIQYCREKILMQCASGLPSDCKDIEGNPINAIDSIHCEVSNWLDELTKENDRLCSLLLLRDDWDEKERKWRTATVG